MDTRQPPSHARDSVIVHDFLGQRGGAAAPGAKKSIIRKTLPSNGQTLRFAVQMAFLALCIWIGVEFVLWVDFHRGLVAHAPSRPPGVEGFLPISALMSLRYWMLTGALHGVHPAGTVILAAIIAVSVVFKKSFCSWLCPIGTISESLGELGRKLFGRNFLPWRWLDVVLRSLKYLLLAFFAWSIFMLLDAASLGAFLDSPYNRVADVKMLIFFEHASRTTLIVLGALVALSLVIRNFWCRYLCPYGALLGLAGLLSPFRITRNASTCIDCAKCAKACPASIKVDTLARVMSDECTSCMACVDACPVASTLEMKRSRRSRFAARPSLLAVSILLIFMAATGGAMLAGRWHSAIPEAEYSRRIKDIDNPVYQHAYGNAPKE